MSSANKQSYIGVSGVTSPEMQSTLEGFSKEIGLGRVNRVLALGVKAVHKTQFLDVENKYGSEWYPVGREGFTNALRPEVAQPDTIAVAQAYLDIDHVYDPEYRSKFLDRIIRRGQPWLQAIQFDMLPWHADESMWDFLETVKDQGLEVFLQAHKNAMEALGPKDTARILGRRASVIDYVLFDSSHGTGTRLDVTSLEPFIAEAYEKINTEQTGISLAGGLNARVIREELPGIVANYPDLSWDAEGQLHPTNSAGKRPLDPDATREYLAASFEILSSKY